MTKLKDKITMLSLYELSDGVRRQLEQQVVATFSPYVEQGVPFPSYHKHIVEWYLLENGSVVGFNENTAVGYSYIHKGRVALKNFYQKHNLSLKLIEKVFQEKTQRPL